MRMLMSFSHKVIHQICHQYAIIDTNSNEWLAEAEKYSECLSKVPEVVPVGREYVIVAVLKQAFRPQSKPTKHKNENKTNRTNHGPRSSG